MAYQTTDRGLRFGIAGDEGWVRSLAIADWNVTTVRGERGRWTCMAIRGTEEVGFRGEGFVEMVASSYCLMGNRNTAGRPWANRGRI